MCISNFNLSPNKRQDLNNLELLKMTYTVTFAEQMATDTINTTVPRNIRSSS